MSALTHIDVTRSQREFLACIRRSARLAHGDGLSSVRALLFIGRAWICVQAMSLRPRGRHPRCARFLSSRAAPRAQAPSRRSKVFDETALRLTPARAR